MIKMVGLDEDVRTVVEKNVDSIIKDPEKSEKRFSLFLTIQGIEHNLETILSFINGLLFGMANDMNVVKNHRSIESEEEVLELMNLLKRRAWEMRQVFIKTRIEQ
ncbi:MAG: hypothetical protein V1915_01975 [Candidatus Bathyarchaeota archaeon]